MQFKRGVLAVGICNGTAWHMYGAHSWIWQSIDTYEQSTLLYSYLSNPKSLHDESSEKINEYLHCKDHDFQLLRTSFFLVLVIVFSFSRVFVVDFVSYPGSHVRQNNRAHPDKSWRFSIICSGPTDASQTQRILRSSLSRVLRCRLRALWQLVARKHAFA